MPLSCLVLPAHRRNLFLASLKLCHQPFSQRQQEFCFSLVFLSYKMLSQHEIDEIEACEIAITGLRNEMEIWIDPGNVSFNLRVCERIQVVKTRRKLRGQRNISSKNVFHILLTLHSTYRLINRFDMSCAQAHGVGSSQ